MKKDSYQTILAMCRQDPLTDGQLAAIAEAKDDRMLRTADAAEYLGVSVRTLKRMRLPTCRINGRQNQYRISDLQQAIANATN